MSFPELSNCECIPGKTGGSLFLFRGVDREGKVVLRKRLSRNKLAEFMAKLTPCLVAMEACDGSHY
jgi:transposase